MEDCFLMGLVVTIKIKDDEIWLEFKDYVLAKHGKLHGALGEELTEALRYYLKEKPTRTHINSAYSNAYSNVGSRTLKNLKEITDRVLKLTEKEIPQTMVERIITETAGGESRTLRRYIILLNNYGILEPVRRIHGTDKFIFEVNLDGAKKLVGLSP